MALRFQNILCPCYIILLVCIFIFILLLAVNIGWLRFQSQLTDNTHVTLLSDQYYCEHMLLTSCSYPYDVISMPNLTLVCRLERGFLSSLCFLPHGIKNWSRLLLSWKMNRLLFSCTLYFHRRKQFLYTDGSACMAGENIRISLRVCGQWHWVLWWLSVKDLFYFYYLAFSTYVGLCFMRILKTVRLMSDAGGTLLPTIESDYVKTFFFQPLFYLRRQCFCIDL